MVFIFVLTIVPLMASATARLERPRGRVALYVPVGAAHIAVVMMMMMIVFSVVMIFLMIIMMTIKVVIAFPADTSHTGRHFTYT